MCYFEVSKRCATGEDKGKGKAWPAKAKLRTTMESRKRSRTVVIPGREEMAIQDID